MGHGRVDALLERIGDTTSPLREADDA